MTLDERGLPEGYVHRPDWELTPRQVKQLLDECSDVVLIDCRTPAEHALARLPESRLVPLHEAGSRSAELSALAGRKVVTVCHHGMRSLRMVALLRQLGVTDAWSLAGGLDLWSRDVDPAMPRY